MHIAFLIRSLEVGGAERQLVALANGLEKSGHRVTVYIYYRCGGPLERALMNSNVNLVSLDKSGRWDVIVFLFRLFCRLRADRPDILHGYLVTGNLLVTALAPLVGGPSTIWGVRASNMDLIRYDALARMTFRFSCWLSRFPDLIIVNSKAGKAYHVAEGYPAGKMVIIPNGIDTEYFHRDIEAGRRLREQWSVSPNTILIGTVGRLDPMKDHPAFLRAARVFADERRDVRFVCVGDGPPGYRTELHRLSDSLSLGARVIWAGAQADLSAVYSALDVFTLTSAWGEGFPNVVAEAMACDVPVVATDVGDAASIVGSCGTIVPPGDPMRIANAWRATIAEPESGRRAKIRARIVDCFSLARLVKATSAVMAQLHSSD